MEARQKQKRGREAEERERERGRDKGETERERRTSYTMDTPGENVPEAETTTTTTTAVEAATPEGTLPKEETKETGPELTVEEDRGDKDKEQQPIQAQPPTTQTMEPGKST